MGKDTTEYYHLTSDYVKTEMFNGKEMLVIEPEALTVLARQCTHDNAFMLRREHNEMVAKILHDPEASPTINSSLSQCSAMRKLPQGAAPILPGYRHSHHHG